MNGERYLIMAYIVGVLVLWGYGALLWLEATALRRRETIETGTTAGAESET